MLGLDIATIVQKHIWIGIQSPTRVIWTPVGKAALGECQVRFKGTQVDSYQLRGKRARRVCALSLHKGFHNRGRFELIKAFVYSNTVGGRGALEFHGLLRYNKFVLHTHQGLGLRKTRPGSSDIRRALI